MQKITVNVLVEVYDTKTGETKKYKVSNGAQFTATNEKDLFNLLNLSSRQVMSEAMTDSLIAFSKNDLVAQDAIVMGDE